MWMIVIIAENVVDFKRLEHKKYKAKEWIRDKPKERT